MEKFIRWPQMAAVVKILREVFEEHKYSDKILEKEFKINKKWGANDRRVIAEATYDILRWWRRLHFYLNMDWTSKKSSGDYWRLTLTWMCWRGYQAPSWEVAKDFDWQWVVNRIATHEPAAADKHSVPDDLYALGSSELLDKWESYLSVLNEQAPVFLRTNTIKINRENLLEGLKSEGVEVAPSEGESAIVLTKRSNVFLTESFKKGYFEVQDIGSQAISRFVDPKPGDRVIDACAGAGGKSLHMAALMKNKGKIIALDIHDWKLKELAKRAKRGGVDVIECRSLAETKAVKRLAGQADKLLLDVPCTGLGVLKRNPDTKWKFSLEKFRDICGLQQDILQQYSHMVKVGGEMVYSTCSILPSENQNQVESFLNSDVGKNWAPLAEKILPPMSNGNDGFYMSKLIRKE